MSRVSWSDAFRCRAQKLSLAHCFSKQQRLYFLPLPQGQGSFLPILPFPGESIMSTHYPPKSGKTRAEVHAFVDFLLSIRLPPALESGGARDAAELSTAGCWRLPSTSAATVSTVHEGSLDRHGEVLEKSPPVKDAEPASFLPQWHIASPIASRSLGFCKQAPIYSDPSL